jgi:hypothetical protein
VGCIGRGTFCSGMFYQVRNRHVMFRNVGPYEAAPQVVLIHHNQESFDPLSLKVAVSISEFYIRRAAYANLAGARSFIYVYIRESIYDLYK